MQLSVTQNFSFSVLCCFHLFQFKVKKSKKWACKVCGEKQSIKKVYAQGSSQDCRRHVQKLNMKCGEAQMAKELSCEINKNISDNIASVINVDKSATYEEHTFTGESKWKKFMKVTSSDENGKLIIFC